MMYRRIIISLALFMLWIPLSAQDDDVEKREKDADLMEFVAADPHLSIDTTFVKKYRNINNYSLFGVQYGANLASASMNPTADFTMQLLPVDVGILYTRYCKMFGYMPYFAFQGGIFYSEQAFRFAENEDTGRPSYSLLGAYKYRMPVVEVPFSAQMHYDFWKMKIMVNIGFFGGYRLGIKREYNEVQCRPDDSRREYERKFHENERRFFYGIQGGGGLALIFDPIEIHFTATYKYGLSYLYKPNISTRTYVEGEDKSNYYYTWTNTTNIVVGVGIHYQLTRRIGSSKKMLREEAKRQVDEMYGYGNETDNGKNR